MRRGAFHIDGVFVEVAQHECAFERSDEERCYFLRVCSGTNLAALYTPVYYTMDGSAPVVHGGSRAVSQHLVGIIGLDCRVQDRTAASHGRIIDLALKDGDDGEQALYGVKLASQCLADALPHQFVGIIERFQGQLFFAREVVIDATFLQPGFAHNVGERRAGVPLAIEELRRARQYPFARLFSLTHLLFLSSKALAVSLNGAVARKTGSCVPLRAACRDEPPGYSPGPCEYSARKSGIRQNHEPRKAGRSSRDSGSATCLALHNPSATRGPDLL